MKRILKIIAIAVFAVLLLLTAAACGASAKQESDIKEDLAAYGCLPSEMKIDKLDIRLRQTDKNAKTDEVWITVSAASGGVDFTLGYELSYTYYDKGGWVLENVQRDYDGVDETQLLDDIKQSGDYYMEITKMTGGSLSYGGPSEDLTQYNAAVNVESENDSASCQLEYDLVYLLTKNGWELDSVMGYVVDAVPKVSATQDEIMAYVSSMYDNEMQYDYVESDYESGQETHYVSLLTRHNFMTQRDIVGVQCSFNKDGLTWDILSCDNTDTKYDWDALGTWTCSGEAEDVRAIKTYQYTYSATVTVTQLDANTLQVVYDVVGFLRYDKNISGTVYFDLTQDPHHAATQLSYEHWYLDSGSIDSYATVRFDADEGLKLRQDGSGVLLCTRVGG